MESVDDLYVGVQNRNPAPQAIIDFLKIKKKFVLTLGKGPQKTYKGAIIVPSAGKVAVSLGSCCRPIPGDDIVGFITMGKGITVHRLGCPNMTHQQDRLTEVFWNDQLESALHPVEIKLECADRQDLIIDVMGVFSQLKVPVSKLNAKLHHETMTTTVTATISVSDSKRLSDVINVLLNVAGIYKIHRVIH
jgi:GTP pyrophosphokinase